jgi:uncharacterized membrane protein YfcA
MRKLMKSVWFVAAITLVGGSGVVAATWVRGEHGKALQVLVLIVVLALALLLGSRSETFRRAVIDQDERGEAIGLFAGTIAGLVVFGVVFVIFLVEFARGHSGEPYYWLSGLYYGSFVVFGIARGLRH